MDPLHDLLLHLNAPQPSTVDGPEPTYSLESPMSRHATHFAVHQPSEMISSLPQIDLHRPEQRSEDVDLQCDFHDLRKHDIQPFDANMSWPADQVECLSSPNRLFLRSEVQSNISPTTARFSPSSFLKSRPTACNLAVALSKQVPMTRPRALPPQASARPVIQGTELVPVGDLPDSMRLVFSFPLFNLVQSQCFEVVYNTDDNLVVSAPTGSGKTAVFELAICRLKRHHAVGGFKVIYMSPTKALCAERYLDWTSRFHQMGLRCAELTGDTESSEMSAVQSADIIITTPEKWEATTRRWSDRPRLLQLIKLVLIDEIQILKEARGATVEAVVTRLKTSGFEIRFLAVSATVPNAQDVADWLKKNAKSGMPACCRVFGEQYRPVPLQKHVIGLVSPGGDLAMENVCDARLPKILATYSAGKPTLIFCSTRKSAVKSAEKLAAIWRNQAPSTRCWNAPPTLPHTNDSELQALLACGIGYHHAGLDLQDRATLEETFRHGQLAILCCTCTLAVGVNLPCYLAIIKNTAIWRDGTQKQYSDLEIMQMLGRAGRPQFEEKAVAIILTRQENVPKYQRLVSGEEILESSLHLNLIEYLNAEVWLGTIRDVQGAQKWLMSTFLAVRLRRNRQYYALSGPSGTNTADQFILNICERDISLLQETQLVSCDLPLRCTEFGTAMAKYCVKFDSMQKFIGLPDHARGSEILSVLASAAEFRDIRWRAGEKAFYKALNALPDIKFPIKVDLALSAHKISLIIQTQLARAALPGEPQLQKHKRQFEIDRRSVFQQVHRLIRSIVECQVHRRDARATRNALSLSRSLGAECWDDSPMQMMQIPGIGPVAVRKLIGSRIESIDALGATEPHRIGAVLGKGPNHGQSILSKVEQLPRLKLCITRTTAQPQNKHRSQNNVSGSSILHIEVEVGFLNNMVPEVFNKRKIFVSFFAEIDEYLIDYQRFSAASANGRKIRLAVESVSSTQRILCSAMCDDIAGSLQQAEVKHSTIKDRSCENQWLQRSRKFHEMEIVGKLPDSFSRHFAQHQPITAEDPFQSLDDMDLLGVVTEVENQSVIHPLPPREDQRTLPPFPNGPITSNSPVRGGSDVHSHKGVGIMSDEDEDSNSSLSLSLTMLESRFLPEAYPEGSKDLLSAPPRHLDTRAVGSQVPRLQDEEQGWLPGVPCVDLSMMSDHDSFDERELYQPSQDEPSREAGLRTLRQENMNSSHRPPMGYISLDTGSQLNLEKSGRKHAREEIGRDSERHVKKRERRVLNA